MKKVKNTEAVSTIVGEGTLVEGGLQFEGTVRIDGRVRGKIHSESGTVIIGETAIVEADIKVDVAILRGNVRGTIEAGRRIEAYPPCRVEGNIQAPTVSIEAGVLFNGNCLMQPTTVAAPADLARKREASKAVSSN